MSKVIKDGLVGNTNAVSGCSSSLSIQAPALYVVATPIGHLGDLSERGLNVLRNADCILCEDKRRTGKLCKMYGFKVQLLTYNDHNHAGFAKKLVSKILRSEAAYALVSDAGTPLISDPGYKLVLEAVQADLPVIAVPGPSAVTAALSIAGLPTDRFLFEGFLPRKQSARTERLSELIGLSYTVVIFESPQRIRALVETIANVLGAKRKLVLVREITKLHEQVYRGPVSSIKLLLDAEKIVLKGEFVVLIGPDSAAKTNGEMQRVLDIILPLTDKKTAVKIAKALTGESRNAIYEHLVGKTHGA